MSQSRQYNSPAREQAKAETRSKIIAAVVRVVLDDGVHAFTVQNVANKAGVSHRTVYRHFQTAEELLDGLAELLKQKSADGPVPSTPVRVEDVTDSVVPSFEGMSADADAMRAYVMTSIALRWQDAGRLHRTRAFDKLTAAAFPNLSPAEVREAGAIIRSVASSRSWYQLTVEAELDARAAARAADWAIRTLFEDLRRRNRAARKPTTRT